MSQGKFVTIAAVLGLALPLGWMAFYWAFLRDDPARISSIMASGFDRVLIALWPSWLFLIADPQETSVAIPAAAVLVNGVLYGTLGWLLWIGIHKMRRAFLAVPLLVASMGWYFLQTFYYLT